MLEGLEEKEWGKSSHAYGEASDVPGQLRDLLHGIPDRREAAFEALSCSICHQGTVYPASVLALPFLIEILGAPEAPDREAVAALVAGIMNGQGYAEVHYREPRINPFTRQAMAPPPDLDERLREERRVVADIRRIGARAVPLLLPFLADAYSEMRLEIARAVGLYPEEVELVVPALRAVLLDETAPNVRHEILTVLEQLERPGPHV
jgi:hypothetical protein